MKQEEILTEKKKHIEFPKLKFARSDLEPSLSEENVDFHYGTLTKAYFEKFNKTGDQFQYAGAFLHTLWWEQFSKEGNKPLENTLALIEKHFKSFDKFKEEVAEEAMKIHGSGWVYLSHSGSLKIIKNHEVKNDILLIIDYWEHSFQHDYGSDKEKYTKNLWKILDWSIVETRLNAK